MVSSECSVHTSCKRHDVINASLIVSAMMDSDIKHLPLPTRAKLRSTQILSSLSQVVSELLQNALDAEARHVDVGVDCEEWTCWVRDDGVGISKDALDVIGGGSDSGRYSEFTRQD